MLTINLHTAVQLYNQDVVGDHAYVKPSELSVIPVSYRYKYSKNDMEGANAVCENNRGKLSLHKTIRIGWTFGFLNRIWNIWKHNSRT